MHVFLQYNIPFYGKFDVEFKLEITNEQQINYFYFQSIFKEMLETNNVNLPFIT
jgi:hypothetical protein